MRQIPKSFPPTSSIQFRNELAVFRAAVAELSNRQKSFCVVIHECNGIEPQTGKHFTAKDSVRAGIKRDVLAGAEYKPIHDPVGNAPNNVLSYSKAAINLALCSKIEGHRCIGDFCYQFRAIFEISVCGDPALSAMTLKDAEQCVRLGHVCIVEADAGVVRAFNSRSQYAIHPKQSNQIEMGSTMIDR